MVDYDKDAVTNETDEFLLAQGFKFSDHPHQLKETARLFQKRFYQPDNLKVFITVWRYKPLALSFSDMSTRQGPTYHEPAYEIEMCFETALEGRPWVHVLFYSFGAGKGRDLPALYPEIEKRMFAMFEAAGGVGQD